MKILIVSDFGVEHTSGGAQRSNQIIIDEGKTRGHEIKAFHYDTDPSLLLESFDIVVSSNLEVISGLYPELVKSIPLLSNHVRLEHDSNKYWNNEFRKYFWSSCLASFFLTDFHIEFFRESYGDIFKNVHIVPDPISWDFYNQNRKREDLIGYVGYFHELKGTGNFINFANANLDKKILVAGWGEPYWEDKIKNLPNVEFLGKMKYESMPDFYNQLRQLYYNPICNEPFCRSVGEALMCGVEIIGDSDKIGSLHMYKNDPNNFHSRCHNAAKKFWEILENV